MRISMIAAASLIFAAGGAIAAEPRKGHSEYLALLTTRALSEGFPGRDVRLLEVTPGPGREAGAKALVDLLGRDGFDRRLKLTNLRPHPREQRVLTYVGGGGYLDVFGDGTKLRVRAAIDDQREIERAGTQRLEKADLEQLGQRFVRGALSSLVKLGNNERVTFLGVRYMYEGEGSATDTQSAEKERVIANIAIFGREIAGLPVVGPGSKIAVWFDNSRLPIGFDVDWPVYRVSNSIQQIVPRGELGRRVAVTTVPLEGSQGVTVQRFECGYVDLGATRRGKILQAGCSLAYGGQGDKGTVWARTEFIPAGVQVLKEARWPLANALAEGQLINTASPEFQRFLAGPKPAPEEPIRR